ncbi:MAG: DUF4153 domain-containing protein [Bacteroidota bacterium]
MKLPSLNYLTSALIKAMIRFPFTMGSAFVGVIVLMFIIAYNGSEQSNVPKIWLMAQIGLPLFTGLTAFSESRGWARNAKGWGLQLAGLGLLVLYGFLMPDFSVPVIGSVHLVRYVILLLVAHLFTAVAPYLNNRPITDFWEYNKQLFANLIIGTAYTLILFAGLSLALLAVNQLFNLDLNGKIYMHLFVLLAGIFNTTYFLSQFPEKYSFDAADLEYNIVFKTLCKYILIPIVGLYFLILYAYCAKILINWQLPHGWVSALVIGFSVAGIFTYLLNYRLPQFDDSWLPRAYLKWFWWIMLPMIVMLFVAVGRRIGDYGFTVDRFLVAHIGGWLLICGLYFAISKTDNIKFVPISLALFGLTAVLGPFSAFEVSLRSQKDILKQLLEQNDRFADGKIKKSSKVITDPERDQIISALYFFERQGNFGEIKDWLPMPADSFPTSNGANNNVERIAIWIGAQMERPEDSTSMPIEVSSYNVQLIGKIDGYQSFHQIIIDQNYNAPNSGRYFEISASKNGLSLWDIRKSGRTLLDEYDLSASMKKWTVFSHYGRYSLPAGAETIEVAGRKTDIKIVIKSLYFISEKGNPKIINIEAIVFLKEKARE